MKNKEFRKLLKKNKFKSNSGFTLTELLVGLIMSTFVIGALGFGLMQVLRVTQKGNSETAARNESSRALDFISDEMRRASAIEVKMADSDINTVSAGYGGNKKSSSTVRLALQIPGLPSNERVIYSVAPPESGSPWEGPLVIYRWGPNLNAKGDYTSAGWSNIALVDGLSDENQTVECDNDGDGIKESITYQGFFACVVDDDGDSFTEDAADTNGDGKITFADAPEDQNNDGVLNRADTLTSDTNGDGSVTIADSVWNKNNDGKIDDQDGADIDGQAITAQLYFTGGTKVGDGVNTGTYSADTKTVARARNAPVNNTSAASKGYVTAFRTLDPSFGCNKDDEWGMRTDFGDSLSSPSNIKTWDHKANRQPQPITINGDGLVISSIPMSSAEVNSSTDCLNRRANNGRESTNPTEPRDFEGNKSLDDSADWVNEETVVAISHAINFDDPRTFNGDPYTCNIRPCDSSNEGRVYTQKDGAPAAENPYVIMLKNGSPIPDTQGYDMNGDGDYDDPGEQISLRDFLDSKDFVTDDKTKIKDDAIGDDERIIAFEIGKDDLNEPHGVDFQDNIFILRSDAFSQKYKTYSDNHSGDPNYTPQPYFTTY